MLFTADLHIHSRFARATSRSITLPSIVEWAKLKGIDLIAIPDYTHPVWLKEVEPQIEEDDTGFYVLKSDQDLIRTHLVFSTELSCIFNRGDKNYRIHFILVAPDLPSVKRINQALSIEGNLDIDGRPTFFGKDIVVLLDRIFNACPDCIVFPAHIWTPWFSLFGSRSGFNSFEECFKKFSDSINAVETGESSDPAMNWRVKQLDKKIIVSFSDAHSQINIGREATVFEGEFSFAGLRDALSGNNSEDEMRKKQKKARVVSTIEFYPQEGKYHYTGHRNCGVVYSPEDTKKYGVECPICHKPLTVGVMHRVEELAERSIDELGIKEENGLVTSTTLNRSPYRRFIQLHNVIAQALMIHNSRSDKVIKLYKDLCTTFGSELNVLMDTPIEKISEYAGDIVGEAIRKNRVGEVKILPGYDGVYGSISIPLSVGSFDKGKTDRNVKQTTLF